MFQFPKGRNDDALDGLWYAVHKSRPPISKKFEASQFKEDKVVTNKIESVKRTISWITGLKN